MVYLIGMRYQQQKLELAKDLWIYGQNTQIVKYIVGGLKNPYSLLISNIFLNFLMKLFFYAYKSWGHDPIFMSLHKIQWTQSFAFSKLYSNQPKSEIYPKMPMFEQLKK
jgi:hypothetical protein